MTQVGLLLGLLVLAVLAVADVHAARRSAAPSAPSLSINTTSTNTANTSTNSSGSPVPQDLCRNGVVMSYTSVFTRNGNATEFQAALTKLVADLLANATGASASPWLSVALTNFTTMASALNTSAVYFAYDVYSEWSMTLADHLNAISTDAVSEVMGVPSDATALFTFNTDSECGVGPPTTTMPPSASPAVDPGASSEASIINSVFILVPRLVCASAWRLLGEL